MKGHFLEEVPDPRLKKSESAASSKKKSSSKSNNFSPEMEKMLGRIHALREDLEQKWDHVYERGREIHFDVEGYLKKCGHHFPEDLNKFREEERKLTEKINAAIPAQSCLKKTPKSKEKLTQERNAKTLGARKKWIPMR